MKPYPKYKPAGIEWLGDVPEHWTIETLKRFARIVTGNTPPKIDESNYSEQGVPWIKPDNLHGLIPISDSKERLSLTGVETARLVPKDSVLVCCIGTIGKMGVAGCEVTTNQQINSIIFDTSRVRPDFGKYLLLSSEREHIRLSNKVVVSILNKDGQSNIFFALPPLPEQRSIAWFLDDKTAKIDTLIEKKRRLIELLKEERQAVINRAVTKGLNPNAKMKPSGIEWLGDVPERWEVKRLSSVTTVVRGASPRPAGDPRYFSVTNEPGCIPWITVAEITKDNEMFVKKTSEYLTAEGGPLSRLIPRGTLLLSNSGATLGVPKITAIEGCINDGSVAFFDLRNGIKIEFLYRYLSSLTKLLRDQAGQGMGQPNLNTTLVKNLPLPEPPVEEQSAIVAFLDTKTNEIAALIEKSERAISLLAEYRTALITEAVTGRVEVDTLSEVRVHAN